MKPSELLREEHREIGRAIAVVRSIADRIDVGEEIDAKVIGDVLFFLMEFADLCHHGKEERVLFPAVEERAGDEERDLIERLMADHRIGREHIAAMLKATKDYERGKRNASERLAREMLEYVSLLTQHIRLENSVFADLLNRLFSKEEGEELVAKCDEVERELAVGHDQLLSVLGKVEREIKAA